MRMVKASALQSWSCLKESRLLDFSEYVELDGYKELPSRHKLVFVSHRWISGAHPDPNGTQLVELQQRLNALPIRDSREAPILVFYDYCSLPQRPRTADEEEEFHRDLSSLESLSRLADQFIVLSEGYRDYINRAWCFFESITARENMHLFSDQIHIREELECREFLMVEDLPQITSYDLDYKLDLSEVEIIVAVFQHLHNCKVTHSEDMALIKDQLISHYTKRRLTSFGKLVVGMNKFFDIEFGIMPVGGTWEMFACCPFFERPGWIRIPSLENNARCIGGRPGPSLFSLSKEVYEGIRKRYTQGFRPLMRLSIPGVQDTKAYLEKFQRAPDWQEYVVRPVTTGEREDCFPAIDHIIHTLLERQPGFFCSNDRRFLYMFL